METIEKHLFDKSNWGDGPWQNEPDKVQYPDPETGLPCLIVRNRMGALCGYVGVSEGHPYFKKDGFDLDLDVHGGITFSDMCSEDEGHGICHIPGEGEPDHVWWLGFDCNHAYDYAPEMAMRLNLPHFREDVYRDIAYVKAQISSLAKQLKENEQARNT